MRIKAALAAHLVLAFAILAYAISWSLWLPLLAARQGWVSWSAAPAFTSGAASAPLPPH